MKVTTDEGTAKPLEKKEKCMLLQQLPVSPLDLSDGGRGYPPSTIRITAKRQKIR